MAEILYKVNSDLKPEELSRVFKASGIRRPADDLPRLQKMINQADITITAWDGEEIVGVARAITDYSYCCYLSDLAVDQGYQHKGIGKELVRLLQEQLSEEVALILLASPIAMDYYPRIGFDKINNGYLIPRKK